MMETEGEVEAEQIEEGGRREETEEVDTKVDLAEEGTGILAMIEGGMIEGMIDEMEVVDQEAADSGLEDVIDQKFKETGKRIGSRLPILLNCRFVLTCYERNTR